jgi:hypothetical protein
MDVSAHAVSRSFSAEGALRQQLAVFKWQNSRPGLTIADKIFWLLLRRFWVFLEKDADCRVARHCRALAPCGLSALLAAPLPRA